MRTVDEKTVAGADALCRVVDAMQTLSVVIWFAEVFLSLLSVHGIAVILVIAGALFDMLFAYRFFWRTAGCERPLPVVMGLSSILPLLLASGPYLFSLPAGASAGAGGIVTVFASFRVLRLAGHSVRCHGIDGTDGVRTLAMAVLVCAGAVLSFVFQYLPVSIPAGSHYILAQVLVAGCGLLVVLVTDATKLAGTGRGTAGRKAFRQYGQGTTPDRRLPVPDTPTGREELAGILGKSSPW